MQIKEVKESKNKEELKEKIKSMKNKLLFSRLIVCVGTPIWLAILGCAVHDVTDNSDLLAVIALGIMLAGHYNNQDKSHKLYRMEDQLSEVEELEDTEEYTRSLSK